MTQRPDDFPDWAEEEQVDPVSEKPNRDAAPYAKRKTGWVRDEVPGRQWWNWLHWLSGRWMRYFDDTISPVLTVSEPTFIGADGIVVDVDIERFGYATGQPEMILLLQFRESGVSAWDESAVLSVSDVGATEFELFGLLADTEYQYRAVLRDPLNPGFEAISNTQSATTDSEAVLRPQITEPPADAEFVFSDQVFESSAFSTAGTDTHAASQWEFSDADGVYFDSGEDTSNLESFQLPEGVMPADSLQSVRVRHKGELFGWSPWSQQSPFTSANAFNFVYGGNETGLFERIDPATMSSIDSVDTEDARCTAITSAGEFLYAAVGDNIYKIDRRTLEVVGTFAGGGTANGLVVLNGFLFVAGEDQFVRKVDVEAMAQVNTHNALTVVYGITAGNGFVYYSKTLAEGVADGQAVKLDPEEMTAVGFAILEYAAPGSTPEPRGRGDDIVYMGGSLVIASRGFLTGGYSAIWKVDAETMTETDVYDYKDGSSKKVAGKDGDDFFYVGEVASFSGERDGATLKFSLADFNLSASSSGTSSRVIETAVGIDHVYTSLEDGNVRRYRKSNMAQVGSYAATQSPFHAIHYR